MVFKIPYLTFRFVIPNLAGGLEKIEISKKSVYRLIDWDGIESVDNVISITENATTPGGNVSGTHINSRRIMVKFAIDDKDKTEKLRQYLIRTFHPDKEGVLYVERNGESRRINFKVENKVVFEQPNIRENKLRVTVNMLCPNPYFMDEKNTTQRFLTFAPMMSFPLAFPPAGMTTGVPLILDGMPIDNIGDVPFGVIVNIEAYGGDMVNPMISCDDEYIRVKTTLKTGDIMQIDTRPKNKGVYINGVSTFMFERTSRFFRIEPGRSNLHISADEGVGNARTYIEYTNLWLGG